VAGPGYAKPEATSTVSAMAAVVIIWLACAGIGYAIGNAKGRGTEGLLLGLILGVIGIIIIALLKPRPVAGGYPSMPPVPSTPANPMSPTAPSTTPAGWHPDPSGRHQHRYWDGSAWTEHVADNGVSGTDPVDLRG
jgi:hypothetical protein